MAKPSSVSEALSQGYVIVEKGDTLSEIELKYRPEAFNMGHTLRVLNNMTTSEMHLIYVGEKIYIKTTQKAPSKNNTSTAKITRFGLQSKPSEGYSNRTVFATWTWDKANVENYKVKWEYDTGDGVWFVGTDSTVTAKQSIYDAPAHAKKVRFTVKPVSKKRTINGKESSYWTAGWSTSKKYSFKDNPPSVPGKPTITIENLKLTAKVDASDLGASIIQFWLWKDGKETSTKGKASLSKLDGSASYEFKVAAGSVYNVKCRSYGNGEYSPWSDPSDEKGTVPPAPSGFTKCLVQGDNFTEVALEWKACKTATSYEIEWVNDRSHFDTTDAPQRKDVGDVTKWTFLNMEEGKDYYFRVRAKNANGVSAWSSDSKASTNKIPAAPTTWSSNSSVMLGEPLTLYWVHNAEDGHVETSARLRMFIDGVQQDTIEIKKSTEEGEREKVSKYEVPLTITCKVEIDNDIYVATDEVVKASDGKPLTGTLVGGVVTDTGNDVYVTTVGDENVYFYTKSAYHDGAILEWDVQTMGGEVSSNILDGVFGGGSNTQDGSYSQWSVRRTIYIYAPPTFELSMRNASDKEIADDTLVALPFIFNGAPGESSNQAPISFHIAITTANSYITVDDVGHEKQVIMGETIYSKYVEVTENNSEYVLNEKVSAGDIILENNQSYTATVTMAMNSGLTAVETIDFTVAWSDTDDVCEPNAEIIIDEDDYSASIRPYCETIEGTLVEGVTLAVYRRETNGKFTEIASGLSNSESTFVLDPHPSLDYARYRIVATYETTGAVVYSDLPGIPVGCNAAIIQWDETWSSFDISVTDEGEGVSDRLTDENWTGSMLKIPYNIDISDKTKVDVELVEYIGREHPVSYYGTHLGESSDWNMVIPKSDTETLFALRRLSVWMGDVYVREPSGTGYWAHISVTYPLKHREVTIPISMSVTRVEGGI